MRMTKWKRVTTMVPIALLSFGLIWAGCGGGGGSSPPPPTPITSVSNAEYAASVSNQAAKFAAGTSFTFLNMGMFGLISVPFAPQFRVPKSMELTGGTAVTANLSETFAKSSAVAAATSQIKRASGSRATIIISDGGLCLDNGSWSADGSADDVAGTFNMTLTFNNCQEYDTEIDGTYSMSGAVTASGLSMNISLVGFSITAYDPASNYGTILASMTADIGFTGSVGMNPSGTSLTISMTGNGTMGATQGAISYDLSFNNYSVSDTHTPGSSFNADTITVNGGVGERWTIGPDTFGASITYENFVVGIKVFTNWDEEVTVNGIYTIDFTPDACFEGRFSIQTIIPVYWDDSLGYTTGGRVVVNSNTTLIFNNDGTVTVQYEGTNIPGLTDVPEVGLDGVCLIAAL